MPSVLEIGISMFADDSKLFWNIDDERNYQRLQNDLYSVMETSSCEEKLRINVDNKLNFNVQAEKGANKGKKLPGKIHRTFTYHIYG